MRRAPRLRILGFALFAAPVCWGAGLAPIDVKTFGAKGDTQTIQDAAMTATSALLSSPSAPFSSADTGKTIIVSKAAPGGANLVAIIQTVQSPGKIVLSVPAGISASAVAAWWGTDDSSALARAIQSGIASSAPVLVSAGTYLVQTRLIIKSPVTLEGVAHARIAGDPGDAPLITAASTSGVQISSLDIANLHVNRGADIQYSGLVFSQLTNSSVANSNFEGGRPAIMVAASQNVVVSGNRIAGAYDSAICVEGGSSDIQVSNNQISGSRTTGVEGPPHDINFEDVNDSSIDGNIVADGSGFVEAEASCLQVFPNHQPSAANVSVTNNGCVKQPGGTIVGFIAGGTGTYNNILLSGNTFANYETGIQWSMAAGASMQNVTISGNSIANSAVNGIKLEGISGTETPVQVTISNNSITGPGAGPDAREGMLLSLLSGLTVSSNSVSNNGLAGIALYGVANASITGNTIVSSGLNAPSGAIEIRQWNSSLPSQNNTLQGNSVGSPGQPSQIPSVLIFGDQQTGNTVSATTN